MGISVTCTHCATSLRVKQELAGKRGKCPKCQGIIEIPSAQSVGAPQHSLAATDDLAMKRGTQAAPVPATPAKPAAARARSSSAPAVAAGKAPKPSQEETREAIAADILRSFKGFIAPVSTSAGYKLGMVFTLTVMILMPALYLALIVALAVFLVWYAIFALSLLGSADHFGELAFGLIMLGIPVLLSAVLLLFMIKPLFARRADEETERIVTPESEPLLFAFVERVCAALGAPKPARIQVDCAVNASASFTKGIWSHVSNDLTLTIGLPLVAGLTINQLAGVLAHEFGHFTQGAGMRVTYLVRRVNLWFARVVFERDAWDMRLDAWAKKSHLRIGYVFAGAQLLVALTRLILLGLMYTGHAVCSAMLRQMEYNADLHEIRLAGSGTFIATQRSIGFLSVGFQSAIADLNAWSRDKRLADNLPLLTVLRMRELPPETRKKITDHFDNAQTGLLASHPSDKDRVAQAEQEQAPGVFQCVRPATDLMSDFCSLCRSSTLQFYQHYSTLKLDLEHLQDTEELFGKQNVEDKTAKVASRYFQESVRALRPFVPPSVKLSQDAQPDVERLKQLRVKLFAVRDQYLEMVRDYDGLLSRATEAYVYQTAVEAGFSVGSDSPSDFAARCQELESRIKELSRQMGPFESGIAHRLLIALNLLQHEQIAAQIPDAAQLSEQAGNLLAVVRLIDSRLDDLRKIRDGGAALGVLLSHFEVARESMRYLNVVGSRLQQMHERLKSLYDQFEQLDYPLEQGTVRMTVSQFLLWQLPDAKDLLEAPGAASTFMENSFTLKYRIMIALGEIGERVESALGLPPLEGLSKDPQSIV